MRFFFYNFFLKFLSPKSHSIVNKFLYNSWLVITSRDDCITYWNCILKLQKYDILLAMYTLSCLALWTGLNLFVSEHRLIKQEKKKADREKNRGVNSIVQCTQRGISEGGGDKVESALDRNSKHVEAKLQKKKHYSAFILLRRQYPSVFWTLYGYDSITLQRTDTVFVERSCQSRTKRIIIMSIFLIPIAYYTVNDYSSPPVFL